LVSQTKRKKSENDEKLVEKRVDALGTVLVATKFDGVPKAILFAEKFTGFPQTIFFFPTWFNQIFGSPTILFDIGSYSFEKQEKEFQLDRSSHFDGVTRGRKETIRSGPLQPPRPW